PFGPVTCSSWSSCSGEESRSRAALRNMAATLGIQVSDTGRIDSAGQQALKHALEPGAGQVDAVQDVRVQLVFGLGVVAQLRTRAGGDALLPGPEAVREEHGDGAVEPCGEHRVLV